MAHKQSDPLLLALQRGESYTWTVPDGGDLASMRKAIRHGQTLTLSPVRDLAEIQVGDKVLVKWGGGDIFHLVGDIREGKYLIVNSLGGVNGWVGPEAILGRVTQVVEPEPRPTLPDLLDLLGAAFELLIEVDQAPDEDADRLLTVVEDLSWYAERLGEERWDVLPRQNLWSFHQNVWHLAKRARTGQAPVEERVAYFTDLGKQCVGLAAEALALFEYPGETAQP